MRNSIFGATTVESLAESLLQNYAKLLIELNEVKRLEKEAEQKELAVSSRKNENEKLRQTSHDLSVKLAAIDRRVLDSTFAEIKMIKADLETLNVNLSKVLNYSIDASKDAEDVVVSLRLRRRRIQDALDDIDALRLTQTLTMNKSSLYVILDSKLTKMNKLNDEAKLLLQDEDKKIRAAKEKSSVQKSKLAVAEAAKCDSLELIKRKQLFVVSDFVDKFHARIALYHEFSEKLCGLLMEYQEKTPGRWYQQAEQRKDSVKIIFDEILTHIPYLHYEPDNCLNQLVIRINEQIKATQKDHRKGSFSFFTSSELVLTYQKALKLLPEKLRAPSIDELLQNQQRKKT